jgi:hypothetical protein
MRQLQTLFFFFGITLLHAQIVDHHVLTPDTAERYRFEMRDGSIVYGSVIASDQLSLTVETLQLGTVMMQKGSIREVRLIDMAFFFDQWHRHPIPHEYLVTQSAHMLEKGTSQYRTIIFNLHGADVGIMDNLSAGAGFIWFSPFHSWDAPSFHVRAKAGHRLARNFHVAGSGMMIGIFPPRHYDRGSQRVIEGVVSGVATYGTTDTHLSIGGGRYLRQENDIDVTFLTVAASIRVARTLSFITENWLIPDERRKMLSLGMRLHGRSVSFDLAAIADVSLPERFQPWPFLGVSVLL